MRDLNRLIGPVPLVDAHVLSPLPSVDRIVSEMEQAGVAVNAPIWFFERVRVDMVDPTALLSDPDEVQKARMNRLAATMADQTSAIAVLAHDPKMARGRGEFRVVDGALALTAAYTGSPEQVLAWVAHRSRCCPAGAPRSTAPRWG